MKQKKYWLRGAIIGLLIVGIFALIVFILEEYCKPAGDFLPDFYIGNECQGRSDAMVTPLRDFFLFIDVLYYLISPFIRGGTMFSKEFYHIYTIWPSVLVIGGILGWFYGKIKYRDEIPLEKIK